MNVWNHHWQYAICAYKTGFLNAQQYRCIKTQRNTYILNKKSEMLCTTGLLTLKRTAYILNKSTKMCEDTNNTRKMQEPHASMTSSILFDLEND